MQDDFLRGVVCEQLVTIFRAVDPAADGGKGVTGGLVEGVLGAVRLAQHYVIICDHAQ